MKKFILLLTTIFPSLVYSQVPHTFQSGDPVSSSKINENFAFVGKRLYLKSDGNIVGQILSYNNNCPECGDPDHDFFVTSKGYFHFGLYDTWRNPQLKDGVAFGLIYFGTSNCTGDAYVRNPRSVNTLYGNGSRMFYFNVGSSPSGTTFSSYLDMGSCRPGGYNHSGTSYRVLENDESITGFPNSIGTLTISYE